MRIFSLIHLDDPSGHRLDEVNLNSRNSEMFWTPELNNNTHGRILIKDIWKPFDMEICRRSGKPKLDGLEHDIYSTISTSGCGSVISNRAKEVLSHEFPNEATYLPINVLGIDDDFWVLWVNTIIDNVIDLSNSEITEMYPGIKHLSWREYNKETISNLGMFRLPMIYGSAECDHVTDKFKEVVLKHELKGFDFWNKSKSQK